MSGTPLLDPNQTEKVRSLWRSFVGRYASIVVCFLPPDDDGYEANAGFDGVDPEWPAPGKLREHERCQERAEVGRQNDKRLPDVDFASSGCK